MIENNRNTFYQGTDIGVEEKILNDERDKVKNYTTLDFLNEEG